LYQFFETTARSKEKAETLTTIFDKTML